MATKVKTETPIELPAMNIQHAEIVLVGDSPLISHKWSEKSKKEIRDKQQKKANDLIKPSHKYFSINLHY